MVVCISSPEAGERILHGQRVGGVVRVTDNPARGGGRAYLVERGPEQDGNSALKALVADYLEEADRLLEIPMAGSAIGRYLEHLTSKGRCEPTTADHFAQPGLVHGMGHHQRLADDPAVIANLDVLSVQPQVRVRVLQRPGIIVTASQSTDL